MYTFDVYQASYSVSAIVPHPVRNAVYCAKQSHHQRDSARDLEAAGKMCGSSFSFVFLLFSLCFSLGGHFNLNVLLRLISVLPLLLPGALVRGKSVIFPEVKAGTPDLGVVLSSWVSLLLDEKNTARD